MVLKLRDHQYLLQDLGDQNNPFAQYFGNKCNRRDNPLYNTAQFRQSFLSLVIDLVGKQGRLVTLSKAKAPPMPSDSTADTEPATKTGQMDVSSLDERKVAAKPEPAPGPDTTSDVPRKAAAKPKRAHSPDTSSDQPPKKRRRGYHKVKGGTGESNHPTISKLLSWIDGHH